MDQRALPPISYRVAFDEVDGEGIIFFGNYFRMAHRALEDHLPRLGIEWQEWFANSEFGAPLRHAESEFLKPIGAGETYQVEILVQNLGDSSVQFAYRFLNHKDEEIAKLKTTHVFIDRRTRNKMPVPQKIRNRLQ